LKESGYGLHTYFEEAPYMLAANTAWLVPNTTQPPLDDPAFRRALAFSVDTSQIVNGVYGNMVSAASPTGLLPVWDEYIDDAVVEEHGFSYNPDEARSILADAGYVDNDGDGFVEAPDGSAIDLSLIVPNGWTDWMESIRVISDGAAEVGIRVTPEFPDFAALLEARNSGNFDLVINNEKQISATPWEYFDYMFRLPIEEQQVTSNFSRYENEDAWNLVQQFDQTPETDTAALQDIASQLEEILLTDLPVIPLWYNGAWSQANTGVWSGWPSAEGDNNYFPVTWNGWWTMTGVLMLAELEPTPEG
jgi:peptide/nickel transport system substrate-binding protein